jgi:hypothetical protein
VNEFKEYCKASLQKEKEKHLAANPLWRKQN